MLNYYCIMRYFPPLEGILMELTDKLEIKVFILFLMKNINEPLDIVTINDLMLQDAFVNYFDFSECFYDLLESKQVFETRVNGEPLYQITPEGIEAVENLEDSLYASVKDKALRSALRLLALKRHGNRITSKITENGDGYTLETAIVDNEKTLFRLEVYLTEEDYAKRLKNNFDEKAEIIYKGALSLLSGDVNFIFNE